MNKLWLIVKREYLTRVRKKTFILATLLTPLAIGLLMFVSGYMASSSMNAKKNVVVVDRSGILKEENLISGDLHFDISKASLPELDTSYIEKGYDLLLDIPPLKDLSQTKHDVNFYSKEKLSLVVVSQIERKLAKEFKKYKISQSEVDQEMLDQLEISINMSNAIKEGATGEDIKGDRSNKISIGISTALSYIMGFMMYMVIFIYGSMVMRSVMEEKINRIVEVMISSVKPFQLMLGKVLGVGFVAMTQLCIWLLLLIVGVFLFGKFMVVDPNTTAMMGEAGEIANSLKDSSDMTDFYAGVMSLNWFLIIPSFVVFFFGGYFIYSSLFAAIGSAMGDDLGEGQQLMMPIVFIVIIAMSMIVPVLNNPNGGVAIFGSMFPLFSPILMPARLPFEPPLWQVIISILILAGSIVFMTWVAGRIYRVGILMYGKKVSFKEIGKWLFYKG